MFAMFTADKQSGKQTSDWPSGKNSKVFSIKAKQYVWSHQKQSMVDRQTDGGMTDRPTMDYLTESITMLLSTFRGVPLLSCTSTSIRVSKFSNPPLAEPWIYIAQCLLVHQMRFSVRYCGKFEFIAFLGEFRRGLCWKNGKHKELLVDCSFMWDCLENFRKVQRRKYNTIAHIY